MTEENELGAKAAKYETLKEGLGVIREEEANITELVDRDEHRGKREWDGQWNVKRRVLSSERLSRRKKRGQGRCRKRCSKF